MPHGPEHHIEHAEHASHAAHDPFDRRVTLSIAIVAAILAAVTMLGHRAHNETLLLQGEAISLQSSAAIAFTETTNKWAQFQALNIRSHAYGRDREMLELVATREGTDALKDATKKRWTGQVDKYEAKLPELENEARELSKKKDEYQQQAKKKIHEAHDAHARANRLDMGELFVEFAVILCSIAVLTKRRGYWYVGLISCAIGLLIALSGFLNLFMSGGHH